MAFYYDNRYGDILFSEHEYYGGNIHFPRETRPAMHEWAIFGQLVSDLPNMYGDLYESFKAKGYDMNDPLWKRENMKEVRAARDRGDRSDRSIRPDLGYGGMARDAWGFLRDLGQPGTLTRVSEPLFSGHPMDPWSYETQPGFDRNGDAYFVGSGMLGSPPRRGRRSQVMEGEQEANFYRQLMDNQQERDRYRQLRHGALPNIDFGMMLTEPRVLYFDPVRDGFDDSLFPNASGHRYLMKRRWLGDQNLMSSRFFGGPGDLMGTRARHRRRELEDEMLPDIGPMNMRLLGWWAQ